MSQSGQPIVFNIDEEQQSILAECRRLEEQRADHLGALQQVEQLIAAERGKLDLLAKMARLIQTPAPPTALAG